MQSPAFFFEAIFSIAALVIPFFGIHILMQNNWFNLKPVIKYIILFAFWMCSLHGFAFFTPEKIEIFNFAHEFTGEYNDQPYIHTKKLRIVVIRELVHLILFYGVFLLIKPYSEKKSVQTKTL
jgi:hypothetical protein